MKVRHLTGYAFQDLRCRMLLESVGYCWFTTTRRYCEETSEIAVLPSLLVILLTRRVRIPLSLRQSFSCRARLSPMKFLILALLGLTSTGFASDSTPKTKELLLDLEAQVGKANLACDYSFFRKVEAEEFFFTGPSGKVTTREEDLAGEKDCKKHEGTYTLAEPRVLLYGDTAGVAVKHSSRFTDVFVRRTRAWVMVTAHSSTIKDPAK